MSVDVSNIRELLEKWNVRSLESLKAAARDDRFRKALTSAIRDTAKRNGATLTLVTAASWISIAVGSIGIAGLGGAIGVPLAVILIPLGLLGGGFLDEEGLLSRTRKRCFTLLGIKNTEDQKERDAELAVMAQSIQLISDRVDSLSERADGLDGALGAVKHSLEELERRQRLVTWSLSIVVTLLAGAIIHLLFR